METISINLMQLAFGDFDYELNQTRRLLEVIPDDKLDYKPHPKAWTLGGLAQHVANLPWLFTMAARENGLDVSGIPRQEPPRSQQEILDLFDRSAADARSALAEVKPDALMTPWTFRAGDHVIFSMPRGATLRGFCISHMIHHRAQLTIYLRLLDARVPGLYGPSSDER